MNEGTKFKIEFVPGFWALSVTDLICAVDMRGSAFNRSRYWSVLQPLL